MHRALGLSRSTRGVNQNRQVIRPAGPDSPGQRIRVAGQVLAAEDSQVIQAHDARVFQFAQAFHVEHNDFLQAAKLCAHFKRLVQLLVVLNKQDAGTRVLAEILHLARCVGGIDAVGHTATRQDGQVGQQPLDDGIGQDGSGPSRIETKAHQASGNLAHGLPYLLPAPAAPDAHFLLPHPYLMLALIDCVPEHCGNGVAVQFRAGNVLGCGIPELGHRYLQFFFFFQRRSPRTPVSFMPR